MNRANPDEVANQTTVTETVRQFVRGRRQDAPGSTQFEVIDLQRGENHSFPVPECVTQNLVYLTSQQSCAEAGTKFCVTFRTVQPQEGAFRALMCLCHQTCADGYL